MLARDRDILAEGLDLSEVQIGHRGEEASLVLWFEAVDLQGIEWDGGIRLHCLAVGAFQFVGACFGGRFSS
jgi:hypothetical protein